MMKFAKRFLAAACLVLCLASAGWCIDPFKVNPGGFGPKIKGIQLGTKLPLLELVAWGVAQGRNMELYIMTGSMGNRIDFTVEGQQLKDFEVFRRYNQPFVPYDKLTGKLGDILATLESAIAKNPEKFSVRLYGWDKVDYYEIYLNASNMRISDLKFWQRFFGAEQMTTREFLQEFINAYHIPSMDGERGGWRHRNLSEGWELICSEAGTIKVTPIVTQSKFD